MLRYLETMPKKRKNLSTKITEVVTAPLAPAREIEDEDDLTSARIVKDGDREEEATEQDLYSSGSDSDDDETNDNVAFDFSFAKERSTLRNRAAAKLAETDPRYRGKKASRKQLEKERGNLSATSGNVDEIEAAQAEWGDMFEVGDDEEIDEDDEEGLDFEGEAPKKSAKGQKGKKTVMDESEDEESLEDDESAAEDEEDGFVFEKEGEEGDFDYGQFGGASDEEDDSDGNEDDGEDDNIEEEGDAASIDEDSMAKQFQDMSDMEDDDGDEEDEDEEDEADSEDETKRKMTEMRNKSREGEVKKGKAVQHQLSVWESLLEVRIQLQKALGKVNQFPQPPTDWKAFMKEGDENHKSGVKAAQKALGSVLGQCIALKTAMIQENDELRKAFKRSKPAGSDGDSGESENEDDDETEGAPSAKSMKLSEYAEKVKSNYEKTLPWRDLTIDRWNDKTRLASGVMGDSGKSFSGFESSTLKQIEQILSDKSRLIKRSQTKRSAYQVLGKSQEKNGDEADEDAANGIEVDPEIFDDDDFYHQLLRELIDRKAADVTDPVLLGRHWLKIQKLRSKMKKKVDTRASKGRKTRYDIHAKLVNFMAPIYKESWKDSSKNELYSSLFGGSSLAKPSDTDNNVS